MNDRQPNRDAEAHGADSIQQAVAKRRGRFSPIWLIPVFAAGVVAYLVYTSLIKRGPLITITFNTADGLSNGQTQVKYKAVELGTVEGIELTSDMSKVIVHVRMEASAKRVMTEHARFWVVRPRLNAASISGLETLVSGAYIEVDPGQLGGHLQTTFTGLEEPPGTRSDIEGHTYILKASRLGTLSAGAPVFYRDVSVGETLSYDLGDGRGPVSIRIFVRAPYDKFVHAETRFWNASGISLNMGAEGVHIELQSLQALLSGGIAFKTALQDQNTPASDNDASFRLYEDEARADVALYRENIACVSYFQSSVQALSRGSPVQLFGVQVGTVTDVRLVMDSGEGRAVARVSFDLQPERLLQKRDAGLVAPPHFDVPALVGSGMRVVLDASNFLTGQKLLTLQYLPGKASPGKDAAVELAREGDAWVLPSQGGGIENITASMSDLATKLDQIPFDEIGANINRTLKSLSRTVGGPEMQSALASLSDAMRDARHLVHQADEGMTPVLKRLPDISDQLQQAAERANTALGEGGYGQNSEFQKSLGRLMDQVNDTARTIRLLADFLDRHPESLIRGRSQGGER